jgi:DNA-directed RNA polymerase subunit RPC12/RpoP
MLAILNAEKLRVWCSMCGTELQLPTFPPLLARCTNCGMKSAVRGEEGGRYVVLVSPPPKP